MIYAVLRKETDICKFFSFFKIQDGKLKDVTKQIADELKMKLYKKHNSYCIRRCGEGLDLLNDIIYNLAYTRNIPRLEYKEI